MKTLILYALCFLGIIKICYSQSIVSVTPSSAFSGDIVTLQVNFHNTSLTTWSHQALSFDLVQVNSHMWYWGAPQIINDTTVNVSFTLLHDNPVGYYDLVFHYYYEPLNITLTETNAVLVETDPTPPRIIAVSPDSSMAGKAAQVYIVTENAHFDPYMSNDHSYLVHDNDTIQAFQIDYWQPWNMLVTFVLPFGLPTGDYDVHIGNWHDGDINLVNGFKVIENPNLPFLVSCSPDTVVQGGTTDLIINARNTDFASFSSYYLNVGLRKSDNHEISTGYYNYTNSIAFGDSTIHSSLVLNYLLPPGTYDVITQDPLCGSLVLPEGLLILEGPNPPSIVSVMPDTLSAKDSAGNLNGYQLMTATGINTHFGAMAYMYTTGPENYNLGCGYMNYINDTCFQFELGSYVYELQPGWHNFYFGNQYENLVLPNAFYMVNPTYGMDELTSNCFRLFPNPTHGIVTLETMEKITQPAEITVTNVTGQIIEKIILNAGTTNSVIDFSAINKGIYFVKLSTQKGSNTFKLLLQ